jgi:predicted PurR-regulated permease PerM
LSEDSAEPAPSALRRSPASAILAIIASVAALYLARGFLVPLLIGILLSYTLRPAVDRLQALRLPRMLGAALVLALLSGSGAWLAYAVSDDAVQMVEKLPEVARKLRQGVAATRHQPPSALQNMQEAANELQRAATDATGGAGARAAAPAPGVPLGAWLRDHALAQSALLLAVLAQMPIVLLLAYFLLASGNHFRRKLVQFVGPSFARKKDALRMLGEIDTQIQRFLLVTVLSNLLIGLCTWLAFLALGMEQAAAWGVFAGVAHFVPYLGPLVVSLAAGAAALLQFGDPLTALGVAAVAGIIGGVIGMGFVPWLQSRFARINAAVLFIALLFFGWLWGVAGLLLGAPLIAIAKVVCDRVEALQPVGNLLGADGS